jgi:hypothetical protein
VFKRGYRFVEKMMKEGERDQLVGFHWQKRPALVSKYSFWQKMLLGLIVAEKSKLGSKLIFSSLILCFLINLERF